MEIHRHALEDYLRKRLVAQETRIAELHQLASVEMARPFFDRRNRILALFERERIKCEACAAEFRAALSLNEPGHL